MNARINEVMSNIIDNKLEVQRKGYAIRHRKHNLYYSIRDNRVMCSEFFDEDNLKTLKSVNKLYNRLKEVDDLVRVELDYDKGTVTPVDEKGVELC